MCARGTLVKSDDRGKGRKLVSLSVLEETCRGGDRLECSAEIGEHPGSNKEDEWREVGQGLGNGYVGSCGGRKLSSGCLCFLLKKEPAESTKPVDICRTSTTQAQLSKRMDRQSAVQMTGSISGLLSTVCPLSEGNNQCGGRKLGMAACGSDLLPGR